MLRKLLGRPTKLQEISKAIDDAQEKTKSEEELEKKVRNHETEIRKVKRITHRLDQRVQMLEKQAKVITRES